MMTTKHTTARDIFLTLRVSVPPDMRKEKVAGIVSRLLELGQKKAHEMSAEPDQYEPVGDLADGMKFYKPETVRDARVPKRRKDVTADPG